MFATAFPIIATENLEKSLGFYQDLLGFTETYRFAEAGEKYVSLRLGDSALGIGENPARPATAPAERFQLCVYADDCAKAVAHLREHGVEVLSEPALQPWGEHMALVADPDGYHVVIMSK
ncbi:VOC family protein [Lentzea kentuckyensis]|uniref:VOC family protein n=1 Tax=Lentzea kentuckyensis TaxID=360086 RepID=UPI001B80CDBD|nr:VOC family protein [Lentzea kentuckyensis]